MNSTTSYRLVAVLGAALFLGSAGCSHVGASAAPAAKPGAGELSPETVIATYGANEKVTAADLDKEAGPELKKLERDYRKQVTDLRKERLEQMIFERLIKAEATKRGISEEDLVKAEVHDKLTQPSDEEIQKVFEANSGKLPEGITLEQVKPQIIEFLTQHQKQEVAKAWLEKLRKDANVQVMLPEPRVAVEAKGPSRGPADAKVTIVEFSDFECPFCGKARDTVEEVMAAYPGKLRLVFRQFPLPFHPHAAKAAEAALCAHEQGKFWEMHDALFKNQKELEPEQIKAYAKTVGVDEAKFAQCFDAGKTADAVKADSDAGKEVGVEGTPAFFVNGVFLSGAQPVEEFKRVIDAELAK